MSLLAVWCCNWYASFALWDSSEDIVFVGGVCFCVYSREGLVKNVVVGGMFLLVVCLLCLSGVAL